MPLWPADHGHTTHVAAGIAGAVIGIAPSDAKEIDRSMRVTIPLPGRTQCTAQVGRLRALLLATDDTDWRSARTNFPA